MKRNRHPDFIGIEAIKAKQKWQLDRFEQWAAAGDWRELHRAHYDWWMFPIDAPSSYGFVWTVYEGDIAELKKDVNYIQNYLRGVELLALAWGWHLTEQAFVASPASDQRWHDWPIRLYKCAKSLQLFGFVAEFESMKKYAQHLIRQGKNMVYNGRDLSELFR